MQSKAKTVAEYLASLPPERRAALQTVRDVVRRNLDPDYEEGMQYGAIGYFVPHRLFPAGYHCDPKIPLPFAGLGWQKHHISLGLMGLYWPDNEALARWFREAWRDTGKKLDMGKVCIRFKKPEDAALDVIAEAIRRMPAKKYVAMYEAALGANAQRKAAGTARPAGKSSKKPAPKRRKTAAKSR